MTVGTKYEQGMILLAPFPFDDCEVYKTRPIVVVSNENYNENNDTLITVPITSSKTFRKSEVTILPNRDLYKGSIPKPSKALQNKEFTIHKGRIHKALAVLQRDKLEEINALLSSYLSG
jgi:mRNA-degrading endonuclease toxin of MazEF toxin-antitoxin module